MRRVRNTLWLPRGGHVACRHDCNLARYLGEQVLTALELDRLARCGFLQDRDLGIQTTAEHVVSVRAYVCVTVGLRV